MAPVGHGPAGADAVRERAGVEVRDQPHPREDADHTGGGKHPDAEVLGEQREHRYDQAESQRHHHGDDERGHKGRVGEDR